MKLAICVATMQPGDHPGEIKSVWEQSVTSPVIHTQLNSAAMNFGVVGSYERLYQQVTATTKEEILCYIHDDVTIYEKGWGARVLQEFEDPSVGIVGFGGAKWHGTQDLYKVPYHLPNLRRGDYLSNVDDAEVHGSRFVDATDVAVLDGFCLVIRRSLLDRINGWKVLIDGKIDFIAYDYVICALARRYGYKIRVVGVRCHHHGGGTSVKVNVDRQAEYDYAHKWCYENLRDVLPARV